jgi:hypothetical protein
MNTKVRRFAVLAVAFGVLSGLTGALAGAASGTTEIIYDFNQQPSLTIEDAAITPAVSVRTTFPAVPVTLTLQNNLVGGKFACASSCPFQVSADGSSVSMLEADDVAPGDGVATFTGLAVTEPQPDYQLRAESVVSGVGPLFATSDKFTIAHKTTTCDENQSGTTCSNTATSPSGLQTVTVVATGPDGWTAKASVGIAFYSYATVFPTAPAGCTSATRTVAPADAYGYFVDVEDPPSESDDGGVVPTKTVTTNLNKLIVKPDPNNGVTHVEVCLGASKEVKGCQNTSHPNPNCTFAAETQGGVALYDARICDPALPEPNCTGTDRYWGVLPDCTVPAPVDPCVKSRRKDKAGNAVITHIVPSPWDEYTHVG